MVELAGPQLPATSGAALASPGDAWAPGQPPGNLGASIGISGDGAANVQASIDGQQITCVQGVCT